MIDFDALNADLLARAREWIPSIIPGGRWRGREYVCGSIQGGEGESFSVNSETGKFSDFAGGPTGGDLVALYAAVRGLGQREAALELGATDRPNGTYTNGHAIQEVAQALHEPDAPPPAPPEPYRAELFRHSRHGLPSAFWVYRSSDGQPLFVVARYDPPPGAEGTKQIVPWTWNGSTWSARAYPKPRPLYGLENLPPGNSPVLLVEGEKTCDAAQRLFPEFACLTWCGGASAVKHADWAPLAGRNVTLWPDNDEPGRRAAAQATVLLLALKATVSVVDPSAWPEGWDLADATPEDDLRAYAAAHVATVSIPQVIAPRPRLSPDVRAPVTRLQTSPAPRAAVIDAPAPAHSLYEIYARYEFMRKTNGRPYCNEQNVERAILFRGWDVYFDEFSQRIMLGGARPVEWNDGLSVRFASWLQKNLELADISPRTVRDGVTSYALDHPRNPVREWLLSLEWDGHKRLHKMLPVGMGTATDEYSEAVGRCFMVGMVARILQPGCQVDSMPVFEGSQGNGKTSALRIIGGEYFAEVHDSIMSKDFVISLAGKMLCEISELGAFKTADIERIKGIISTTSDRYRAPYASTATDHPRQGVFSGTTNRDDWNTDETGARRFWPVMCGDIDLEWLRVNRDQLFAEAVALYDEGRGCWWDVPSAAADIEREGRQDSDPWEDLTAFYLRNHNIVKIPDIMIDVLSMKPVDMTTINHRRLGKILRKAGYRRTTKREASGPSRMWERKP